MVSTMYSNGRYVVEVHGMLYFQLLLLLGPVQRASGCSGTRSHFVYVAKPALSSRVFFGRK